MSESERPPARWGPRPRHLSRSHTAALLDEMSRAAMRGQLGASPQTVTEILLDAMDEVGIHPALVYAFQVTGMLVSDENLDLWSRGDLARWDAAIADWSPGRVVDEPTPPIGHLTFLDRRA